MDNSNLRFIYGLVDAAEPEHVRYVGQTRKGLDSRMALHRRRAAATKRSPLYDWFQSLDVLILPLQECADDDELNEREPYWIDRLRAEGHDLFNVRAGGDYVHREGWHHTPDAVARIAAASRGRTMSPEAVAKIIASQKGKAHRGTGWQHSDETKSRISEALRNSEVLGPAISAAVKGRAKSTAHRAALSAANKGNPKLSAAGRKGAAAASHVRWHVKRGIVKPDCPFCVSAS